jgi:hypothetical protein
MDDNTLKMGYYIVRLSFDDGEHMQRAIALLSGRDTYGKALWSLVGSPKASAAWELCLEVLAGPLNLGELEKQGVKRG